MDETPLWGVCIKLQFFTMASLQSLYMALQDGEGFSVNADQKTFVGRGYAVGGTEVPSLVVENDSLSFNQVLSCHDKHGIRDARPRHTGDRGLGGRRNGLHRGFRRGS